MSHVPPATVASFRTWRGSKGSAAPDPPGRSVGYLIQISLSMLKKPGLRGSQKLSALCGLIMAKNRRVMSGYNHAHVHVSL